MRFLIALAFLLLPCAVSAQDWEDRQVFNADAGGPVLRVLSSTDTVLFAPLIEDFISENPMIGIEYLVTTTADIDRLVRADPDAFDIVISSAMDLQLKLANDGFGLPLTDIPHPDWAQWHDSLFAFTSEPASIVINRAAFEGGPIPETRQELIEILRARPQDFRGKVGTYDIRDSGLGYLFATQDARASETYWRLMEVMGGLGVHLYCCSGAMIDDLTDGTISVAYNVLGSYAAGRADRDGVLQVILPTDFQTTMMRTAMGLAGTPEPQTAELFVRYLIAQNAGGAASLPTLQSGGAANARGTIVLGPALLTYLDQLKRRKFLSDWENAVIQR